MTGDQAHRRVIRVLRLMRDARVEDVTEALLLVIRLRERHPHIVAANLRELRRADACKTDAHGGTHG